MPNSGNPSSDTQWSGSFQFLLALLRIRWWLLIHFVVAAACSVFIAFSISKSYKSTLTFLPPGGGGGGGGLSSLLNGMEGLSLESRSVVSSNQVKSIFEGEQLERNLIRSLNLSRHYKVDSTSQGRIHLTRKILHDNLELSSDEQMGVGLASISSFSIICKDGSPDTAALIAKRMFLLLDSAIRVTNVEQARRNRIFIDSQLNARMSLLREQEKALAIFQKKTKIFNAPIQAEASLRSASDLKAKLIEQQTIAELVRNSEGPSSSQYARVQTMIRALKSQLSNLESTRDVDILPSLNRAADLGADYLELYRNVEISAKIVLFLSQQLEMFKMDEARTFSSMAVVSDAQVPDYKSSPKRALVIVMLLFGEHLFLFMLLALRHAHVNKVKGSEAWSRIKAVWRDGR